MPTIFESADQSSSTEYSDELTAALAAGRRWAIMDVSDPIPEDYEHDYSISDQCNTTPQWRQKTMQGAPFASRSTQEEHVPTSFEKEDLTSSLRFTGRWYTNGQRPVDIVEAEKATDIIQNP
ncbi:hypothetical protein F2P79_003240 [Pimephales promelas]|nr:hypothetical protein F2P79_003240 [Pimephales promelas]